MLLGPALALYGRDTEGRDARWIGGRSGERFGLAFNAPTTATAATTPSGREAMEDEA